MFCLYSSCSPSAYLPLQRPMPLWAAPSVLPIGSGVPMGPGLPRGQSDMTEGRRVEIGGREGWLPSHCRGKDGDGIPPDSGVRPFFLLRGSGLPGKRRRCDSPGRSVIMSPPTHSPGRPFSDKYPSDRDSPFRDKSSSSSADRWERSTASPAPPSSRNHSSGSKDSRIEEQREEEEQEEEGVRDSEEEEEVRKVESTDRHQKANGTLPDLRVSSQTSPVVMTTVAVGDKWPTTPTFDCPIRRRPDSAATAAASIQRRIHLPSSSTHQSLQQRSPTPATATKHGALKFGIDNILRPKDTHEVSSDRIVHHHHPPNHHQPQHHQSHHHPLGPPPPPRSHPPLLNIHPQQSKALGGNHGPVIGSNFILTSSAVYSPHLYALQGQLHYPPHPPHPPASSSSSSSSSASPASVHLRPTVLPPPPALHYSLHHPFHINSRHSEFSGGSFGLLGSTPDLHSPHLLHPHSKKKRSWSRAVFSNLQRKGLEKRFEVQKYVTKPDRRQLAAMLGLTDAQVKVWFQNRRMKWRHQEEAMKKKETDPRKPPSQPAPAAPSRRSPAGTRDTTLPEVSGIEPSDCHSRLRSLNHSTLESDDDSSLADDVSSANALLSPRDNSDGLLLSRDSIDGRIHVSDAADVAANRNNGIMSVADILDLRKESVTCTPTNNNNNKHGDNDDDDDDELSVISASI